MIEFKTESGAEISMALLPDVNAYYVCIRFSVDGLRVDESPWANPLRPALDAAEEALNELKCAFYNEELNSDRPYKKSQLHVEHPEEKA